MCPARQEQAISSNIDYIHTLYHNFYEKLINVIKEFHIWVPDDDFVFEEALDTGIKFLKANESYSCVNGKFICFNNEYDRRFNEMYKHVNVRDIKGNVINRTREFFTNYHLIMWGMYRKDIILQSLILL